MIETFNSFEYVATQLPPLLEPSLASARQDQRSDARAIIVGGAFGPKEIASARELPHSNRVPWLQDNKFRPTGEWQAMTAEDLATDFVHRVKSCLREHGLVAGVRVDIGPGELWFY